MTNRCGDFHFATTLGRDSGLEPWGAGSGRGGNSREGTETPCGVRARKPGNRTGRRRSWTETSSSTTPGSAPCTCRTTRSKSRSGWQELRLWCCPRGDSPRSASDVLTCGDATAPSVPRAATTCARRLTAAPNAGRSCTPRRRGPPKREREGRSRKPLHSGLARLFEYPCTRAKSRPPGTRPGVTLHLKVTMAADNVQPMSPALLMASYTLLAITW